IQNVYVSSNPDFVERMKDYGRRIKQGDPIEGFFDEFNETVRRVFPNPR
ncbi:YhcN/YlaJ family sporulation lipoprotein, partial [Neobacillus niacini]